MKKKGLFCALLLALLLPVACNGSVAVQDVRESSGVQPAATASLTSENAAAAAENKLEIFSWWTETGEADAFEALADVYNQRYPHVEIINVAIAGDAGVNARSMLVQRMQAEQPPDSFQAHAGQQLIGSWVLDGRMEPITQLFGEEGWDRVMPRLLLDQIAYNGEIYSVPVNVHRSNMLWYNKALFEEHALDPPTTLDEFFAVAEALQAQGVTPLAIGSRDDLGVPHLFESVLLATFGPADYLSLFQSGGTMWADSRTMEAVGTLERMLGYANADRSTLGWAEAAQRVLDGEAAMTIMGDWVEGYFVGVGAQPGQEFGWVAAPGTEGVFMWLSDSFGLPKGAPHRENAIAWLRVCGSKAGQDAFNPKKGSIPVRTDADKRLYDAYLQWSIEQFASNQLVPSVVHGAAANEEYVLAYQAALNAFGEDLETQALLEALSGAVNDLSR